MATHWTDAWPEIADRLASPPRLLVACDFDGTLTPLVAEPDEVQLPSTTLEVLCRLQSSPGVSLAIISGRPLTDIASRVPVPGVILAGKHGLEIRGMGFDGAGHQAATLRPRLRALTQRLEAAIGHVPGIRFENLCLSSSIHLRNVSGASHEWVIREVRKIAATDKAFRIQQGHLVAELIPDIGWSKGAALKQIIGRMGVPGSAAFYAGDDTTDESVFLNLPTAVTVSVGASWISAARWMARDPGDVCNLLERLAGTRTAGTGHGRNK